MNLFDRPREPSLAESYFYPLAALLLIYIVDHNVEKVLLTPMLSLCLLGILAFRLEINVLTFWFVVLAGTVVLSLVENPGGIALNWETITVRSFGFVIAGTIALLMNHGRSKLIRNHLLLLKMLELLPCGVVVSNSSGTLLFVNKRATELLGKAAREIIGYSFFPSFTSPEQRGRSIQDYLHLSEQEVPSKTNLSIMSDDGKRQAVQATQIPMNLIGQKCIVTVIELTGGNLQRQSTGLEDSTWPEITAAVVLAVERSE